MVERQAASAARMLVFSYSFRRNAFGPERYYRLEPDALARVGVGPRHRVAYADITQIRLYRYKIRGAIGAKRALHWRCTVHCRSGLKIKLLPTHALRFRVKEDRSVSYLPFVSELQARVLAANPDVKILSQQHWSMNFGRIFGALCGRAAIWMLRMLRPFNPDTVASLGGGFASRLGPYSRVHRTARANLAAAYPEKSPQEREQILAGMWDNLGRFAAEYVHLDRLWDYDPDRPPGRIFHDHPSIARMIGLHDSGKPVLVFTGHLANFELLGIASAAFGVDFATIYRRLNIGPFAQEIFKLRSRLMGTPELILLHHDTAFQLTAALKRGASVCMFVDQYHPGGGVDVTFFGRRCKVNPSLAKLARGLELPIHGARVVRLPGHRFRTEFTEPIDVPRDTEGKIDVKGTMQVITTRLEAWVREYPEQWIWAHRRWR